MNNKIMYVNGDVVVTDENNNMRKVPYNDNVLEILATENELEELEGIIKDVAKEIEMNTNAKERGIETAKELPVITLIGSLIMPTIVCQFLLGSNPISKSIFGPMPLSYITSIAMGLVSLIVSGVVAIRAYLFSKEVTPHIKGQTICLEFLKQKQKETEAKLIKLNEEKTKTQLSGVNISQEPTKISNEKFMNYLVHIIGLYYDCGYKDSEYLNYYLNGILRQELKDKYTEEEINLIEQQMKELQEQETNTISHKLYKKKRR